MNKKKATIDPKNEKDGRCFQYSVTITLKYDEIGENHQRIS